MDQLVVSSNGERDHLVPTSRGRTTGSEAFSSARKDSGPPVRHLARTETRSTGCRDPGFDDLLRRKILTPEGHEAALEVRNQVTGEGLQNRRAMRGRDVEELLGLHDRLSRWSPTPLLLTSDGTRGGRSLRGCPGDDARTSTPPATTVFRGTAKHPIAGGVCTGAGIGPTRIDRVS